MRRLLSIAVLMAAVTPAAAHITLETSEAKLGSTYKAVLRVPHGCEGTATVALRVKIPAGMIGVKPMPKPGWTLSTVTAKYDKPYSLFHAQVTEGVSEISWTGGKLLDAWYDEFVFQGSLAADLKAGDTLYVPVVQECEKGMHRWIEIPAAGQSAGGLAEPAPGIRLIPADTQHRH